MVCGGRLTVIALALLHGAAAFVGTGAGLRWPAQRAGSARAAAAGRAGAAALRAQEANTRAFRGPGNPKAAELQTANYGVYGWRV